MKNLSSYCGLIDLRMSASEKDLPVQPTKAKKVAEAGHMTRMPVHIDAFFTI